MPRWLLGVVLLGALLVPSAALAQTPIVLSSLQVQLWPEYDQPSMLVLYDFQVAEGTQLPVGVTIKYPKDANLVAVAVHGADGSLLNADYLQSTVDDEWQSVIVQIQTPTIYRIEYYQPISRSGNQRQFSFQWPGNYRVEDLGISLRVPSDATSVTTDPALPDSQTSGGVTYLENHFGAFSTGRAFTLQLGYVRTSESLTAAPQDLQPTQPLGANTPGRIMLSNYLPYVLGVLGVLLIAGGAVYYWQSSRGRTPRQARRHASPETAAQHAGDVYCHQCGTRAQTGDRFCRVCGTRLRLNE